jgi:molybdate/tungstate transport system ATP-binding protein
MISVDSLSFKAGIFELEDISFGVHSNETLVVLGPTGAGKTVLLELIAGLRKPSKGSIVSEGKDVTRLPPEKRGIGLVYQDYLLFPHLRVFDNIAYGLRAKGARSSEVKWEVEGIATAMGITSLLGRRTRNLSGGEQQRIALARTLVTKPRVLLLDEPFSAVDPNTKDLLMRELSGILSSYHIPVVYVTHDQLEAMEMADKIAVMNNGRIVQLDSPDIVFSSPKSKFVADFVGTRNIYQGEASSDGEGSVVTVSDHKVHSSIPIRGKVHMTIRPEDIIVSHTSLESSARNQFSGKVVGIVEKGPLVFVTSDCGIEITAAITRQSFKELGITLDDDVWMIFKASSVNLF